MQKFNLLPILMVMALFQMSCKDFWHPEGPSPETLYATITLKNAHSTYRCFNAILQNVTTGNSYQFPTKGGSGGTSEGSLNVPAGTYYVTATTYASGSIIRSNNFSVGERDTKIVTYYSSHHTDDGEFRL